MFFINTKVCFAKRPLYETNFKTRLPDSSSTEDVFSTVWDDASPFLDLITRDIDGSADEDTKW
jgi:hypothetical protein